MANLKLLLALHSKFQSGVGNWEAFWFKKVQFILLVKIKQLHSPMLDPFLPLVSERDIVNFVN